MITNKGKLLLNRLEKMKGSRSNWDAHWDNVANFIVPKKDNIYGTDTKGDERNNRLYDSTSIHVNELLASALHGLLTNPTVQFFDFTSRDSNVDSDDEVNAWVQVVVRKIHQVLANSNFHTEIHEVYLDLGSFGTALLRIIEDDITLVRFEAKPIYESYIEEDNAGKIDTVYRVFKWTARQLIQEFGDACPRFIEEKALVNPSEEYEILHAVFPRDENFIDKRFGISHIKRTDIASFYVLVKDGTILSEGGFNEFPYAVPRWTKLSGEKYGRSPGMKALPDIRMLNQVMKTTIRAAQNVIAPPLQVPDDGLIRPVNMRPNGINYYRAGTNNRIEPIVTGGRVDFGEVMMEQIRLRIRQAFFIDQLQLNEGPQMTATEVLQRTEEKVRLLAPILSRLNTELLAPLVERVYGILLRKGEIPKPPQILAKKKLEVVYSSTIAKAQKSNEADTITRVLELSSPFIQLDPSVADNFSGDEIVRYLGKALNAPSEMYKTKKEMEQQRKAKQKQMEQMQQMQQEQHDAEVINKVQ